MELPTGPYPLPGVRMPTWMVRIDKEGACTTPVALTRLIEHVRGTAHSDVIVAVHGWNYDPSEAVDMYSDLLGKFERLCIDYPPDRPFAPVFVGVLWPSIWMSFDKGPALASVGAAAGVDALVSLLADRVAAAGGAAGLARAHALLAAPAIDDADAAELARLIAPAFGVVADEGAAFQGRDTVASDVLAMMRSMEMALPRSVPGADDQDIDDFSRPSDHTDAHLVGASPRHAGQLGLLDPRHALRLFSLYQMKSRAGTVGTNGVATLLRDLLDRSGTGGDDRGPRVHCIGHSFGCRVLLSAICARPLPRPLASLLLLQPAVSHLCFADAVADAGPPGGYREALDSDRVIRPIVSTYSRRDLVLHDAFHLVLRRPGDLGEAQIAADPLSTSAGSPPSRFAALGGYGPRRAGQALIDPLPAVGTPMVLPQGDPPVVAFDGSRGSIKSHSDVTGPEMAWALHQLVFRH
ncbi:hypothetical protein [Variovorax rhizosphaerae]|uniref:Alpha/beta hydrolase n=1 Tax=Variovorax rhizosphaerae TaxID=1836200 RepID=A0ABU8WST3_9BURK